MNYMKSLKIKILLLLLFPFSFQLTAYCQQGSVIESQTMESELLKGQVGLSFINKRFIKEMEF